MIEKLKTINPYDETEIDMDTNSVGGLVYENTPLVQKINELVDAVNKLQKDYDNVCVWVGEQKLKAPADPYAEQRKWIGKACWFWDGNAQTKAFGQLNQIDPIDDGQHTPYQTNYGQWYEHCEPANDDIIYKGE